MSNEGHEFSAKSVDDAIAEGLSALGLTREQADIEIVSKGNRGILGFGSEPAVVRITQHTATAPAVESSAVVEEMAAEPAPAETAPEPTAVEERAATDAVADEPPSQDEQDEAEVEDEEPLGEVSEDEELEALAAELLARMIDLMGFDVEIVPTWETPTEEQDAPYLNLDIRGDDLGVLIGRRGETLANIQFLLRLMVNQRMKAWKNVVVDVEQYKERRIQQLTQLANRMAEQVATGGRAMSLEPMPANERRIIHIALRDHPAVYTESAGEGERRKVTIIPR
jgi:spoIIIJ-associated protein